MSATERVATHRISPVLLAALGALLALMLVGVVAYEAGTEHGNRVHTRTGNAYVGADQATVKVGGWNYGIGADVEWVDRSGTAHDGGWPECLGPAGSTVRIRFGEITVSGPQGDSWRAVVWVDCRGAVRVG